MLNFIDTALEPVSQMLEAVRVPFRPYESIIYAPMIPIAEMFGRPMDEIALFVSICISFVLCAALPCIRNPTARKCYSTGLGLFMTTYTFGA